MLDKAIDTVARCVAENGGLSGRRGRLDVQFLVRARGRAEGVEVTAAKGVQAEAGRCVQQALKNKWVGAPTAEPVGVAVTFQLSAEQAPARPRAEHGRRDSAAPGGDTIPARAVGPARGRRPDASKKKHR
jgi:hypothetical protein